MSSRIADRLAQLGIVLPAPAAPVANYVPVVRSGTLLFVSGQLCTGPDGLVTGIVGQTLTAEEGAQAARFSAVNIIAQLAAALDGDLDRVTRIVKLGGFVASAPDFRDQPKVINGASDLLVEVFGPAGRHTRTAVGTNALPLGAAVEIDAIAEFAA